HRCSSRSGPCRIHLFSRAAVGLWSNPRAARPSADHHPGAASVPTTSLDPLSLPPASRAMRLHSPYVALAPEPPRPHPPQAASCPIPITAPHAARSSPDPPRHPERGVWHPRDNGGLNDPPSPRSVSHMQRAQTPIPSAPPDPPRPP